MPGEALGSTLGDVNENRGLVVLGIAAFGVVGLSMVLLYLFAKRAMRMAEFPFYQMDPSYFPPAATSPETLPGGIEVDDPLFGPAPGDPFPGETARILPPPSQTNTYSLLASQSQRIASAFPNWMTTVSLLATSPPGATAIIATDIGILNGVSVTFPTGNVAIVPVGNTSAITITLAPGESLFAKGSVDDVLLTVMIQVAT